MTEQEYQELKQVESALWALYMAATRELDRIMNPAISVQLWRDALAHVEEMHNAWWIVWRRTLIGV